MGSPTCLTSLSAPATTAMATHMAATVLATTAVPTVPTEPTHTPLTPAMATATHTRVPMLVMVPMAMVVPTLVMATATHTPATTDVAMATRMATKRPFGVKGFGSVADDCRMLT